MNQLELFVASSESVRSDAWRYLSRLRELDCRIEEDMRCLREIARVAAGDVSWSGDREVDERGDQRPEKGKRRRPSLLGGAAVVTMANDGNGDDDDDGDASSDADIVFVEPHRARLLGEYRVYRRRVLRQALEREKIAEELKACGNEMKDLLAVRMAQPKQPLGGRVGGGSGGGSHGRDVV